MKLDQGMSIPHLYGQSDCPAGGAVLVGGGTGVDPRVSLKNPKYSEIFRNIQTYSNIFQHIPEYCKMF